MDILQLTKECANAQKDEILGLESNWTEIGDEAWTTRNLLHDLPKKWDWSHFAISDYSIVGYQIGSLRGGLPYLNKVVVDKKARGLGTGWKLLQEFLSKVQQDCYDRVYFKVREDNPAVSFYDKRGFQKRDDVDSSRPDGIKSFLYDTCIKDVLHHD
jgi:ribosomal protein S18 acetylase RimI-like enzyme